MVCSQDWLESGVEEKLHFLCALKLLLFSEINLLQRSKLLRTSEVGSKSKL